MSRAVGTSQAEPSLGFCGLRLRELTRSIYRAERRCYPLQRGDGEPRASLSADIQIQVSWLRP